MRISFSQKLIYLANPKCGSQSVRRALDHYADIKIDYGGGPVHPHACLRSVERMLAERHGVSLDGFDVVFNIRNPWDRVVSIYHYGLGMQISAWHRAATDSGSVAAFVFHPMLEYMFRPASGAAHDPEGPYTARNFGTDSAGNFRAKTFDVTEMDAMTAWLRDAKGIEAPIPHINVSKRGDYRTYFNDASRERVAWLFEDDIAFGKYGF